ncbi:MAG: 1-aminocyclopropane-carboxylate deaminase [Thermosediminibacterales bacterium]|nr:1-aminocyclopropane-carboxylate deaminase [Thermosediminibacterales bacterium]
MLLTDLKQKLDSFPHVNLLWGATPIVRAENLSKETGVELYIKRDDLTGLALGGNKTRKLEFIMGEALDKRCDTVITAGAVHSNHALQTAAAAKKLGLDAVLVLRGKEENKGNLLMDRIIDAEIRVYDAETSRELKSYMEEIADELAEKGKKPLIIPVGGSNPTGVLGYLKAAAEIVEQSNSMGLDFDYVVSPSSSGGTQTGILLGLKILKPKIKALGIGVGDPRDELLNDVATLIKETAKILNIDEGIVSRDELEACTIDGYGFGGYGTIVKEVIDLIKYIARQEGFYLDPVYTGKSFYGLMDMIRKQVIPQDSKVLFVHTGGLGGVFQYEDIIADML